VVESSGERAKRIVAGEAQDVFSGMIWSPDGKRISYQRRRPNNPEGSDPDPAARNQKEYNESSYSFPSVEFPSGRVLAENRGARLDTDYGLSDGRILFALPAQANSSTSDIWERHIDPRTGELTGAAKRVSHLPRYVTAISAGSDGRQIVAISATRPFNADVHVAELSAGSVLTAQHRLTLDITADYPRAWTPDGKSIIFESSRNGNWDLYRQRLGQGAPEPLVVTPFNEALAQVTPDRRWLLYASWAPAALSSTRILKRIPLEGGNSQDVPVNGPLDEFRCASPGGQRCVLRTQEGHSRYKFYELDPVTGKGKELAHTAWLPAEPQDWGLSSDGSTVALPVREIHRARLRLVSLDHPEERDVVLSPLGPGYGDLREVHWDVKDRGWFVSLRTTVGVELLHVAPDGDTQALFESSFATWGIPSPDGRQIAFIDRRCNSNAWLIQPGN
jgi:Tol biopolymer transport system component